MKYLITFLCILPLTGHASLPYEGATSCKTSINRPAGAEMKLLDAGHEVDRDCKVVFVLPPKRGNAIISSSYLTGAGDYCDFFEETKKNHREAKKMQQHLQKLLVQSSGLETVEIEKIKDRIKYNLLFLDSLQEELINFENTVGLTSKIYFETEWDQLVSEYAKSNPTKFVKKIPTVASMETAAIATPKRPPHQWNDTKTMPAIAQIGKINDSYPIARP